MNFLDFLTEQKSKKTRIIVVYGGGFQPFHQGHMSSYLQAKQKFPSAEFFVASSTDIKKRPIPFTDKKFLAQQAGVVDNFVLVSQPMNPKEILKDYDPEKDILILVRSERDPVNYTKKGGGLSYYQPFKSVKESKPFGEHGYVFVTKKKTFKIGSEEVYSGSQIRSMYASADDEKKQQIINALYPNGNKKTKVKTLLDKYMGQVKESLDEEFEMMLSEGVHDKGIFKAVFLGGGPGSGKDYVMDMTLSGHGLIEINSDKAFEYLMDKNNLNFTMPENEKERRNVVRGKAKTMTEIRERLAIFGRNGLIINGTADDPEKVRKIKEKLEELGYETSMVMVNTRDEISQQRNIERGQRGGRTVPEDLRKEKWEKAQSVRPVYAELFGDRYVEFDNSEDLRVAPQEIKQQKEKEMLDIFKNIKKFVETPPKEEEAKNWISTELQSRDKETIDTKKTYTPHPESRSSDEANSLGLEYYGFGRYGKNGKVTHRSVNDKLVVVDKVLKKPNVPS
jgi:predicted ABC-type ATPase